MSSGRDAVVQQLRELIIAGQITAEERLTETSVAARLGVSRTPVRHALAALTSSGFFEKVGVRGYRVREYSLEDVFQAVEIRSSLEGQAARIIAEAGPPAELIRQLRQHLQTGDDLLKPGAVGLVSEEYSRMNVAFHNLIVTASGSRLIAGLIQHLANIPFASPATETFSSGETDKVYALLHYAHQQHHYIVEAMEARQSGRVEALFREHAAPVKHCVAILSRPGAGASGPKSAARKSKRADIARLNVNPTET